MIAVIRFADAERGAAEDLERQQRRLGPTLDRDERTRERDRCRDQRDRRDAAPAVLRRARQRIDEQHERRRDGRRAGDVEVAADALGAALGDAARHEDDEREPDRER